MAIKSFSELTDRVKNAPKKTVALVGANDAHALEAVIMAADYVSAVLVGKKDEIIPVLHSLSKNEADFEIVEPQEGEHPSVTAAKLIHAGKADFLMKGKLMTGDLLKGVLSPEANLRKGGLMSHIAMFELPGYDKLIAVTDGGMCPSPTLEQKIEIVKNTVSFFHGLGYECPKVAGLCAAEAVSPKIIETVDAAELQKLSENGELGGCVFEGPISYDLAMSREVGEMKGYHSENAGEFDVLLVPNLVSGNLVGKIFILNCKAVMAGLILGAKVPIVLTSRGASSEEKFNALIIAAGACV